MPIALILSELVAGTITGIEAVKFLNALGINVPAAIGTAVAPLGNWIRSYIQGGTNVPTCSPTHRVSSLVQGPGVCCQAWGSAGFASAAPGQRVATTNSKGQCIICEVKTLKKGGLGFKRGKAQVAGSQVACPSNRQGCCQLAGL